MIEIFHEFVDAAKSVGREFILTGGHAVNPHVYDRTTIDLDFQVLGSDLAAWKNIMAGLGYSPFHETKAFIQFVPDSGGSMRIDLMLVDPPTFEKLSRGSDEKLYGDRQTKLASILHLIALKLHATRTWDRAVQGKDYYDILNLIRYATESIRERLLSDRKELV